MPSLARVLQWAHNTVDKVFVMEMLDSYPVVMNDDFLKVRTARCQCIQSDDGEYDYNFVIPNALVIKLNAVLRAEQSKRPPPQYFAAKLTGDISEEIVASFSGETPKFDSRAISLLQHSTAYAGSANNGEQTWLGYSRGTGMAYQQHQICLVMKPARLGLLLNRPAKITKNWRQPVLKCSRSHALTLHVSPCKWRRSDEVGKSR
ncbi:hypothetical protein V7S43_005890 [Phytophthora oleae]|uniref:Uncharacterized protein n=1 Tax=Phytophthora oleae TaxID=2107226 RepID=A0ABD3FRD7_9STRA